MRASPAVVLLSASHADSAPGLHQKQEHENTLKDVFIAVSVERQKERTQLMASSSTSNINVAFGGITLPAPRAP